MSLDGIVAPMDGWFDPLRADDDLLAASAEHREAADALVLGRTTYEEFAGFWPVQRDDPTGVADYLDRVAKYVVSTGMADPGWANSTVLRGPANQEIAALKAKQGKDIVVTGSVRLVRSLQASGLIDRYRLFVYPAVQGHGRRLFDAGYRTSLELAGSRSFTAGVLLVEYRPVG